MHVYISGIQVIRHVTPCLFPALRRKLTPLYSKIHGPFAKPGIAHGQGVTSQMNCNPRRNLVSRECSISLSFKTCLLFDFFFFHPFSDGRLYGHVVSAGNCADSYCRRVRFVSRPEELLSSGFLYVFSFFIDEWQEDEEEDVGSSWMTLRKREDTLMWRRKL